VTQPRVSVVIPVYNEGEPIVACLDRLFAAVTLPCEVLAVFDSPDDTTVEHLEKYARAEPRLVPTLNTYGRGPARALRYGLEHAAAEVIVVTMADGSDDPEQIDQLTHLVERGVVIAAASRYMHGGQQIGGPALKRLLLRATSWTLHWFARVGTHDATNSFKGYHAEFVREVGIESDAGFELGIEMVSKARRRRLPVAEVPTIWLDRTAGQSSFQVARWLTRYLRWYRYAFGPKVKSGPSTAQDAEGAMKKVRA
jgi:dolichol-phosphate mannosyltransferase